MATKQGVPFNFALGLETKVDPKQVQLGKFLSLKNSVFTIGGELTKRNGFGTLSILPDNTATYLTTFGGNLTAIGNKLEAYNSGAMNWIDKGVLQPISLSVLPVARSALNQTQCDSVIAANGLVCTVYTEINTTSTYKYVIQDSVTGQNIVAPVAIPVSSGTVSGSPRVFLLGGYFIIIFTNNISGTNHLQYIAISTNVPTSVSANADIAASYAASSTVSWDGLVIGNNLYLVYNTTTGGQAVKISYLTSSLTLATAQTFSSSIATIMSITADMAVPTAPKIYAAFYDVAGATGYVIAVDQNLNKLMTATQVISSGTVNNITCTAQNGSIEVAYEVANAYSYDSTLASNYINKVNVVLPATVTTGSVGSTTTPLRSVGLASKAFLMNDTMYMLGAYSSVFQPTYFLFDINGNIVSRFAYSNGGGYLTLGLPQAQVSGSTVSIAYLFKDLIQSVNKAQGVASASGIYSQTGVNLVSLEFTTTALSIAEIGSNLHLSGGFLHSYDGNTVNEQNFHVWPDNVKCTLVADPAPTGTVSNVVTPTIITSLSSVAGIVPGMSISGTGIPANTTVISVGSTTVTMSASATSAHAAETITFTGNVAAQLYYYYAIYQWTDAQGMIFNSAPSIPVAVTATAGHSSVLINIPTLRLTYKNDVKIILYRWATDQETPYQITSILFPLLNSKTVDSISFTDIQSSAQIVGNSILYTTGGVLENIGGPACTAIALFDNRLWMINAENRNLLGFSKQVIENTPVEMSDLLTYFVAPTTGAQGSTGKTHCLFPMDDKLIVFKADAIYYINGTGPDNTGANGQYSQPIFTTSTVGCTNQNSIVMTDLGLMFQSDKGIYLLTRGMESKYIGAPVEAFNRYTVNSAVCVPGTTQVRFTLSNGTILMFDYYYGQWGDFEGAPAISSTLYQGFHTILNSSGLVSQETVGIYLDNGNPVLMSFITSWINLAGISGYQRIYEFQLLGSYISPHQLFIQVAYDFEQPTQQSIVIPTNFTGSYGSDDLYGQTSPFGGPGPVEQWRVQTDTQKCQAFQIGVQEIFDPTYGSNLAGAGFSLSGITSVVGIKKGYRPLKSANTVG